MIICREIPSTNRPTALTVGTFDGVHLGHQTLLAKLKAEAKARALPASVLTFEPHPREFFAPELAPARLTDLRKKSEHLTRCGVDVLFVQRFDSGFAQLSAHEFAGQIEKLNARYVLIGDDFRFGKDRKGDFDFLKSAAANFELCRMESVIIAGERVSSSAIRAALAMGNLSDASRLLGREYSMSGKVVHGDGVGKQIGFPTANIHLKNLRPPLMGIFVVEASGVGASRLYGVASLGVRPTVSSTGKPVLEVHLFDFDDEIYGRRIEVFFLHKLRDEAKYPDLKKLTEQIAKDVENAKAWFVAGRSRLVI
ncbi:MAG: bifunctional riboflavin kinase/FAD synthetase [Burkholderiales bacterium]